MLNFKPDKLKARLLIMRWAVLGGLVLAVGAVAVFGGARPDNLQTGKQRVASLPAPNQTQLAQTTSLAEQLQAHISQDTQPALTASTEISLPAETPESETKESETQENIDNNINIGENNIKEDIKDNIESDTKNNTEENVEENIEDDEVIDYAPEPWVGDELLTVEANLQQMLPPLSGSSGLLRGFGYGYDAAFDDYRFHGAVDLGGSLGAAVLAPLAGTVKEIREDSFYGSSIVLAHEGKLQTAYFGLTPQPGLTVGQQVIAGEKLGELCPPPAFEDSLTPHLHWEISLDGELLNGEEYF